MSIEYTVYTRIEGYETVTDECFDPDEAMITERALFSTTDVHKAIEFMQSLPTKDDEL